MEAYKDLSRSFEERATDMVSRMTLEEKISQLDNTTAPIPRLGIPFYNYWSEASHGYAGLFTFDFVDAVSFPVGLAMSQSFDRGLVRQVMDAVADEARAYANTMGLGLHLWCPTVNMARDPRNGRADENWGEDPYLSSELALAYVQGLQGDVEAAGGYYKAVATPKHFAMNSSENNRHTGSSFADEATIREYYARPFEAAVRRGGAQSIMMSYNRVNGIPSSCNPYLLDTLLRETWGFDGAVVSDCGAVDDIYGQLRDRDGNPKPGHLYAHSHEEAAAMALLAGTDLCCGHEQRYYIGKALEQGIIGEEILDRAVIRALTTRMRLGLFDPPAQVCYAGIGGSAACTPEHIALSEKMAEESLVLLKNDKGLLPLDKSGLKKVLVVGPNALYRELGGYSAGDFCKTVETPVNVMALDGIRQALADTGAEVVYEKGWCSGRERFWADEKAKGPQPISEEDMKLHHIWVGEHVTREMIDRHMNTPPRFVPEDPDYLGDDEALFARALAAAKDADAVIVVAGTDITTGSEENDRMDLSLPYGQDGKIRQLLAVNDNTVVVLVTMAMVTGEFLKTAHTVVNAHFAGESQGTAIARLLFGEYSPSGRLSATWYENSEDLPQINDYGLKCTDTLDGKTRTYMYFRGPVRFPFGHGLSYTKFEYRDVTLGCETGGGATEVFAAGAGNGAAAGGAAAAGGSGDAVDAAIGGEGAVSAVIDANDTIVISFELANTGAMDGADVPQVYVAKIAEGDLVDNTPIRALKGFERVEVAAGETRRVQIRVPVRALAFWNNRLRRMAVEPGLYRIELAESSADIRWSTQIRIGGTWNAQLETVALAADRQILAVGGIAKDGASSADSDGAYGTVGSALVQVTAVREDDSFVALNAENVEITSSDPSVIKAIEDPAANAPFAKGAGAEEGMTFGQKVRPYIFRVTAKGPGVATVTVRVTEKGVTKERTMAFAVK